MAENQDGKVDSPVNSLEGLIKDPVKEPLEARLAAIERDYSASSKEGKRLAEENKQLKEQAVLAEKYKKYEPFYNLLETDPRFVEHQLAYGKAQGNTSDASSFAGGGGVGDPRSAPPEVRADVRPIDPREYGLSSWDEYDEAEAIANPHSPSGRVKLAHDARIATSVVESRINAEVEKRLAPIKKRLEATENIGREEALVRDFTTRNPRIPANEVREAFEWSKQTQLTPDQIVALYRMDKASKRTSNSGGDVGDIIAQLKRAADSPTTLASKSSGSAESNPDNDFFNLIKGAAPLRVG